MPNLNKVFLMGNLTRDPQLTYTPANTPVCEIGLAINRRWTGQDGQQHEEVTFVDCASYGKTAETLSKYLKKGRPIHIEGRLKLDQWEAQDGGKRSKMRVVIEKFEFVDSRAGGGSGGDGGGHAAGGDSEGDAPAARAPRQSSYRPAPRPQAQPAPAAYSAPDDIAGPAPDEGDAPPINPEDIPF